MEDLKIIRKLPNSTEYLTKLITAANAGDEATIGEVFEKLEQELKKIRNLALTCMDKYGRVKSGNVDDINKNDNTMCNSVYYSIYSN